MKICPNLPQCMQIYLILVLKFINAQKCLRRMSSSFHEGCNSNHKYKNNCSYVLFCVCKQFKQVSWQLYLYKNKTKRLMCRLYSTGHNNNNTGPQSAVFHCKELKLDWDDCKNDNKTQCGNWAVTKMKKGEYIRDVERWNLVIHVQTK